MIRNNEMLLTELRDTKKSREDHPRLSHHELLALFAG